MIEVNLLPGSKRGGGRKSRPALALPKFEGSKLDPWTLGATILALAALAVGIWFFFATAGQAEELEVRIDSARADSARFADAIQRNELLLARQDSIAERVSVLQEIDGARYIWPHIMNEVGRALPDFTWIQRLLQTSPDPVRFRIEGRAATYFALTNFMENLEASAFIRGVRLITSEQTVMDVGAGAQRLVYNFTLEASWQEPPPEVIDREPLFGPSVGIPGLDDDAGDLLEMMGDDDSDNGEGS
ncbi:MAG: hypothetical protein EA352_03730 [Gemmatimonadales bacterium]|nr:MAG: hypothetical protein EA352_03730 [Gemmatimonadales bacterium]